MLFPVRCLFNCLLKQSLASENSAGVGKVHLSLSIPPKWVQISRRKVRRWPLARPLEEVVIWSLPASPLALSFRQTSGRPLQLVVGVQSFGGKAAA